MSRKNIIISVIFVIVAAAGVYAYRQYNRTNVSLTDARPDFHLTADALISEFAANDSIASQKYLGKVISVEGVIRDIGRENNTVTLGHTGNPSSVRCSMDSIAMIHSPAIQPGMTIRIKGSCTGFNKDDMLGSDVILNRCVFDKPEEP